MESNSWPLEIADNNAEVFDNFIDAKKVLKFLEENHINKTVAVMGCVVNGPGEAAEADIGIAGGIGEGLLIKKGEIVRKVPEEELLNTLKYELDHWTD